MRSGTGLALTCALLLGGCGYYPVPPDPIRIVSSPADVSACHRLAPVGIARTDGVGPFRYDLITVPVPAARLGVVAAGPAYQFGSREILGPNLAVRLNVMRDAALSVGATDLLLLRRVYNDWSFVEGVAYRCRH